MNKDGIILNFPKNDKPTQNENILQAQMFAQLDQKGLLKVKQLGASLTIFYYDKPLARVIYLSKEDAIIVGSLMNEYFLTHKMDKTWNAFVEQIEMF